MVAADRKWSCGTGGDFEWVTGCWGAFW